MAYQVIILPSAISDLGKLSKPIKTGILRKIKWISENAENVIHHQLQNMPPDLKDICRIRFSSYRIIYWVYPIEKIIKVYRIRHRSTIYKDLY